MATGVETAVAANAACCCLNCFCQCFDRYIGDAGKNVRNMKTEVGKLVAMASDARKEFATMQQEDALCVVNEWLLDVDGIEQKAKKVSDDYAAMWVPRHNCWSRYRVGKQAFRTLQRVNRLIEERSKFESLTTAPLGNGRQDMQIETMVVGMDPYLERALLDVDDDKVGVIGICGMGGVGKTTLLRRINREFLPGKARSKEFDDVMWAVAYKRSTGDEGMQNDIPRLQNDIAKELGLRLGEAPGDNCSSEALELRAQPIFEYLSNKSFLLLLDDLWSYLDLKSIGIPDPGGRVEAQTKRKVVLTSRLETVCGQMQARITDVKCLEPAEAWRLFVFNATEQTIASHKAIDDLAWDVMMECQGLPLALNAIGKALSTKTGDPKPWEDALDKLRDARLHEIPSMEMENAAMLHRLKLSYDYLPSQTIRDCFLSCCLWPEKFSIQKEMLIECWLGLGLVGGSVSIDDDVKTGLGFITTLKESHLLEPGDDEATGVKMHDTIRDLSLWISSQCAEKENKWLVKAGIGLKTAQRVVEQWHQGSSATERVSLMYNTIKELPPEIPSRPNLKVLMLQRNRELLLFPGSFLRCAPALTYLDLANTIIEELPGEIGLLLGLQYLNLSGSYVKMLPMELSRLAQLRQLRLHDTNVLEIIPYGIVSSLEQLQILDVFKSKYASWDTGVVPHKELAPAGCEEDKCAILEELETRDTFLKSLGITINSVEALQSLAKCDIISTRRLCLRRMATPPLLQLLPSTLAAFLGSLDMLESLQEFTASICRSLEQLVVDGGGNSDGDHGVFCLPRLEKLELLNLGKLQAIQFRGITANEFLPGLRCVKIVACPCLQNVNWALRLPQLSHLELQFCSGMLSLVDVTDEPGDGITEVGVSFPHLKTLTLHSMRSLASLCRGTLVGFPVLEIVEVTQCIKLTRLDIRPQSKLREIRGGDEWFQGLQWEEAGLKESLLPYWKYVRG